MNKETLTERQQKLIEELTNEFIKINKEQNDDSDNLFSHVVLQQQTEIQQVFAEIKAINDAVFSELMKEFSRVVNIFTKELTKLNIPYTIRYPDDQCLEGWIRIGDDMNDSFHINFLRRAETRRIHGESFAVLHPRWCYRLYKSQNNIYDSLEGFTKDQYFIERIGRLHRKHNK